MRITCPFCGERGHEEFSYLGDAAVRRPAAGDRDEAHWYAYVYVRDNPAGPHRELWQHVAGCRSWLVVSRDTRTHEIERVELARDVAGTGTQPA